MDEELKRMVINVSIIGLIFSMIAFIGLPFELFIFFEIVLWLMTINSFIYRHWQINKRGTKNDGGSTQEP